jgi:hypothetical protein
VRVVYSDAANKRYLPVTNYIKQCYVKGFVRFSYLGGGGSSRRLLDRVKYSRNVVLGTGSLNVLSGTLKKIAKGTVVKL